MQFSKKPLVIDAFQYTGETVPVKDIPSWLWDAIVTFRTIRITELNGMEVVTLEGNMAVSKGDWIIRGVKGELYPCKPDIFAATYDAVPQVAETRPL